MKTFQLLPHHVGTHYIAFASNGRPTTIKVVLTNSEVMDDPSEFRSEIAELHIRTNDMVILAVNPFEHLMVPVGYSLPNTITNPVYVEISAEDGGTLDHIKISKSVCPITRT